MKPTSSCRVLHAAFWCSVQWFAVLSTPSQALACKCVPRISTCEAFSQNSIVFAGKVESIEPDFERWMGETARRLSARVSEKELDRLQHDDSPAAVRKLRDLYKELVPEPYKTQLADTKSGVEIEAVLANMMKNGKRIQFRVDEVFKGANHTIVDVWTDFSDCAAYFELGETYLVFAYLDKQGRFETTACSHTQRLTDAGADLAFLHFAKYGGGSAGRLYGWVTSAEVDLKKPRLWNDVTRPGQDLVLILESAQGNRLGATDAAGRFVFDRLGAGEYTLSIFGEDYFEGTRPHIL